MDPCVEQPIRRFERGQFVASIDPVIRETRIELNVNEGSLRLTMLCLANELPELAVGFLRSEGVLRRREDLEAVEYVEGDRTVFVRGSFDGDGLEAIRRRWTLATGCGGGGTSADLEHPGYPSVGEGPVVDPEALLELMRRFQNRMHLWKRTGGVHACSLADGSGLVITAEDVGRHNAFDKVVGRAFLENVDCSDKLVLTTGRLSAEMVSKAIACGLPILASRGAVTALGIDLARRFGITLVGFARGKRLNVYTGYQRIVAAASGSGPPD